MYDNVVAKLDAFDVTMLKMKIPIGTVNPALMLLDFEAIPGS